MKCATCSSPAVQATQSVHLNNFSNIQDKAIQCDLDSDEHVIIRNQQHSSSDRSDSASANLAAIFFSIGSDKRPHVTTIIKGKKVLGLVDTGSQVTVIGTNTLKNFEDWGDNFRPCHLLLRMANKAEQIPLGQFDVEYTFNGITAKVATILTDGDPETLILGMDFQRRFNIGITERLKETKCFNFDSSAKVELVDKSKPIERSLIQSDHGEVITDLFTNGIVNVCSFTIEKTSTEHRESDDIFKNKLITAEDPNDFELDIEVPKAYPVTIPHVLSDNQKSELDKIIALFIPTPDTGPLNQTNAIVHEIDTGDTRPVCGRQFPISPLKMDKVRRELDKMIERGIIKEIFNSPWRFSALAIDKKDGEVRICLDARELNKVTIPNAYPILDGNEILRRIAPCRYITSMDLSQAFHQIPLHERDQIKTTFVIAGRMFCYRRMTMGLCGSPSTLAILINKVFGDLQPNAFVYVDDFIIASETFEQHMVLLSIVAERMNRINLTISLAKSHFCCKQVEFLGYLLTQDGLKANPAKVAAMLQYPQPKTVREVRRFIGAVNWYRRFILHFSELSAPLTDLIKKNKRSILWSDIAETAFQALKRAMVSAPILTLCDYSKPFRIFTDASDVAGAAVLTQDTDQGNRPLCYYSFKFSPTQKNYSASERECMAVIFAIENFRPYIEASKFEVVTDHSALQWLMNTKDLHGRLARWALRLQAYAGQMTLVHRSGKRMELPDALSRTLAMIEINSETDDKWYKATFDKAVKGELDKFKVEDGLLYHRNAFNSYAGERIWVPCVPESQRGDVLKEQHDEYSHMGVWKVARRMKTLYYWPGMYDSVYQYIRKCTVCKCTKPSSENRKTPIGRYRDPVSAGTMLSIDFMGEWPSSQFGHKYIFVVIDCYSRYVWAKAMRQGTAEAVVKFLREVVFPNNGCPNIIISDNGSQFASKQFASLCQKFGIKHQRTPRYHPKANPVESTNKTIKTAIRARLLGEKNHAGWDKYLPIVVREINSTPHTATGCTPQYLHFGRELVNHANEYKMLLNANPERSLDPDRKQLMADEARDASHEVYENRRSKFNRTAKKRNFKVGDVIYIPNMKLSDKSKKYNQKLAEKRVQARIHRKIADDIYEVTDFNQKILGEVHSDDINVYSISLDPITEELE